MPAASITFNDRKLKAMLNGLPDRIHRKVLRYAIGPATSPAVKAAKRLCPKGPTGLLKKSIGRKLKTYKSSMSVVAIIGPKRSVKEVVKGKNVKPSNYAHLVEDGSKAHQITVTNKKTGKTITLNHPGSPGKHFLAKARAATLSQFISISKQRMSEGVLKEGRKLGI